MQESAYHCDVDGDELKRENAEKGSIRAAAAAAAAVTIGQQAGDPKQLKGVVPATTCSTPVSLERPPHYSQSQLPALDRR